MGHKIIFLDFDGVLNTDTFGFHEAPTFSGINIFEYTNVWNLKTILAHHQDAKIVISSFWRHTGDIAHEKLESVGLRAYDVTPLECSCCPEISVRAHEINEWLAQHPTQSFVILDDCDDGFSKDNKLKDNFIRVDSTFGLTEANARRAIQILGEI